MNRVIVASLLLAACSVPVLADAGKRQGKANRTHVTPAPKHKWSAEKAERKLKEGGIKDPYWEPCDYTTSYGPNGCGGD